eukprot:scaffold2858_cov659-Pavlova_lutheri.AAC.125
MGLPLCQNAGFSAILSTLTSSSHGEDSFLFLVLLAVRKGPPFASAALCGCAASIPPSSAPLWPVPSPFPLALELSETLLIEVSVEPRCRRVSVPSFPLSNLPPLDPTFS